MVVRSRQEKMAAAEEHASRWIVSMLAIGLESKEGALLFDIQTEGNDDEDLWWYLSDAMWKRQMAKLVAAGWVAELKKYGRATRYVLSLPK